MNTNIHDQGDRKGNRAVPRVKIHHNQLTLPEELRQAVHAADEDYFDAEVVEEGILLRPSYAAQRRAALADIRAAQAGVRYIGPEPRPSPEEEEQLIADLLAADKAERAAKRRHG